jgi:hypothetical protein
MIHTLQDTSDLIISRPQDLDNLKFVYKKPVIIRFKLQKFIKELKVESNARYIEIYDAEEYKSTITGQASDLDIKSEVKLKCFLPSKETFLNKSTTERVLEIKKIQIDGQDLSLFLSQSYKETQNKKEHTLETLSDQLHLLEMNMDYKLSKIQNLLEQILRK